MTFHQSTAGAGPDWATRTDLRFDQIASPLGPLERIIDAMSDQHSWGAEQLDRADLLRVRLAAQVGVSSDWVVLANGIDELHAMIASWRSSRGPIVLFSPADPGFVSWMQRHADQIEVIPRAARFALPVEPGASPLPRGSTAVVMSPNDPTGTVMSVQETVRLSRLASMVIIDQRHAAYSLRSLMPLVREFDNLVVLQTFETFASLTGAPLAWAIAPPGIASAIARFGRPSGISSIAIRAALAAIDCNEEVRQSVRTLLVEKGRLYRQLRKLSMLSVPYPSWSNFLLARFERGTSGFFLPRLEDRGLFLHEVRDRRLLNHVRISAISADATNRLKQALIEIALDL